MVQIKVTTVRSRERAHEVLIENNDPVITWSRRNGENTLDIIYNNKHAFEHQPDVEALKAQLALDLAHDEIDYVNIELTESPLENTTCFTLTFPDDGPWGIHAIMESAFVAMFPPEDD